MNEKDLKIALLAWLKSQSSAISPDLQREILNYAGNDEVILGAKHFIKDGNSFEELFNASNQKLSTTKSKKTVWYAAASILFVAIAVSTYWFVSYNPYKKYHVYEEGTAVFMDAKINVTDEFMNAYRVGEYNESIHLFTKTSQPNDTLLFYSACSYIELNKPSLAEPLLAKISAKSVFYCRALYQLAYVNACLKNKTTALEKLNQLLSLPEPCYKEEAELLKAELL